MTITLGDYQILHITVPGCNLGVSLPRALVFGSSRRKGQDDRDSLGDSNKRRSSARLVGGAGACNDVH